MGFYWGGMYVNVLIIYKHNCGVSYENGPGTPFLTLLKTGLLFVFCFLFLFFELWWMVVVMGLLSLLLEWEFVVVGRGRGDFLI